MTYDMAVRCSSRPIQSVPINMRRTPFKSKTRYPLLDFNNKVKVLWNLTMGSFFS